MTHPKECVVKSYFLYFFTSLKTTILKSDAKIKRAYNNFIEVPISKGKNNITITELTDNCNIKASFFYKIKNNSNAGIDFFYKY